MEEPASCCDRDRPVEPKELLGKGADRDGDRHSGCSGEISSTEIRFGPRNRRTRRPADLDRPKTQLARTCRAEMRISAQQARENAARPKGGQKSPRAA